MKARQIIESETRRALKHAFSALHAARIQPSRDYYLNVKKEGETWAGGEFCPVEVADSQYSPAHPYSTEQLDGMYGLADDAAELEPHNEDAQSAIYNHYTDAMHNAVRIGTISGLVNGRLGLRAWRLVYWPSRWKRGHVVELGKPLPSQAEA